MREYKVTYQSDHAFYISLTLLGWICLCQIYCWACHSEIMMDRKLWLHACELQLKNNNIPLIRTGRNGIQGKELFILLLSAHGGKPGFVQTLEWSGCSWFCLSFAAIVAALVLWLQSSWPSQKGLNNPQVTYRQPYIVWEWLRRKNGFVQRLEWTFCVHEWLLIWSWEMKTSQLLLTYFALNTDVFSCILIKDLLSYWACIHR